MNYLGIDYHKKYSYVAVLSEEGVKVLEGKIDNSFSAWQNFVNRIPGPKKAVFEAGRTWGVLYEWLEELSIPTLIAHPKRLRAIAEASIKTDRLDAQILARLLKADLIPAIHVPPRMTRDQRQMLRYRLHLVKTQTRIKNRLHVLFDLNHVQRPAGTTDFFGKKGRLFLSGLQLAEPGQTLLDKHLSHLDLLKVQIRQIEAWLDQNLQPRADVQWLRTIPGFGPIISATVALEIDQIERFRHPRKLVAYAGLAPTTYQSSDFCVHGRTIKDCNHWLKEAFIEAAWSAIRSSAYCQNFFSQRRRHKPSQVAIVAVARHLAHIVHAVLTEKRAYEERPVLHRAA